MPWRIEDELRKLGANFIQAGLWKGFAIRDANLVTGQQKFSGTEVANRDPGSRRPLTGGLRTSRNTGAVEMNIAIVGTGRIGGNTARQLVRAGHHVTVSFSRDDAKLRQLADEIGAQVAAPAAAVAASEVVVFSVPWAVILAALEQAGPLAGKVVIDTTNQFGSGPMPAAGQTAAAFNASRMPGARYTKSFNTLTSAFQAQVAHRQPRVVQWLCGDDQQAKAIVSALIADCGYEPVDLGGTSGCAVMEAPRRSGAVYGEEYQLPEARAVVEAVAAGRPIPPTPSYPSAYS